MKKKVVGLTYSDGAKIAPYVEALQSADLLVEPLLSAPADGLAHLDGLVLSGGIDLNPKLYGEERRPEADEPNDARDALEMDLLRLAMEQNMAVLAICRGMQLVNVALGGSLHQHIPSIATHQRYDLAKQIPVHSVSVETGTLLAQILGNGEVAVNSRHHQAVAKLGAGLRVSARAEDGLIEGVEHIHHRFLVGVQWHPEDQAGTDHLQGGIFEAFAGVL
jgi:putative glutamine amidotransferase